MASPVAYGASPINRALLQIDVRPSIYLPAPQKKFVAAVTLMARRRTNPVAEADREQEQGRPRADSM
jgi:hypothetical protein